MTTDLMDARRIATIRRVYYGSDSDEYRAALDHIAEIERATRRPSPEEVGRIYISGAMTGMPDFNRPAFIAVEAALRAQGYTDIANPARIIGHASWKWRDWMRRAVDMLLDGCDTILFIPNREGSRGSRIEEHIADGAEMNKFYWVNGEMDTEDPDLPF